VSLSLKIEVSAISGTGFGGLPTIGNRSINTIIRLKDGETNLLAGLFRDNERQVVEGVAGLSDLPLVGKLFAHTKRETQETDIILTLTPHIIRVLDLNEDDLRPFKVGGEGTGSVLDLPIVAPELPATPAQPITPGPVPAAPPGNTPVQPLQPPPATPVRP
jgi:general secretion pathway protein D